MKYLILMNILYSIKKLKLNFILKTYENYLIYCINNNYYII